MKIKPSLFSAVYFILNEDNFSSYFMWTSPEFSKIILYINISNICDDIIFDVILL